ncbi:hypothetical protein [Erythrobacter sp. SG61-1L]|uniref:hypothetical protein n=1 Tax=Erythrobacter sp. SG61-1L TaxID=1603897 RepID=UPI000B0BF013|nr:hypothetical protein [Erythrobacter sp. SG61-1L]
MPGMLRPATLLLLSCLIAACGKAETAEAAPQAAQAAQSKPDAARALLASLVEPRQKGAYAPKDECGTVGAAGEFRLKLADAVVKRDAAALVELAAPDVLLDFGGGEGRAELRQRLDDPHYRLWEALEHLLPLGCAVNEQGGFTMPWYFAQDYGDRDSYMLLLVRGQGVPLLAEPRTGAKVLKVIDWNMVDLQESTDEQSPFAKVDDGSGTSGYIAWDRLRALVDYRLIVEERDEGWAISAFVAGD